jgi:dihydrofolate reductase
MSAILTNVEAILAIDSNGGLAKDGVIPWKSKTDLMFFRQKTTNNVVLMGSKTLSSLPNAKPLSNRLNIVLTNNKHKYVSSYANYNNILFVSLDEAISILKNEYKNKTIFIIGGNQIFDLFLCYCSTIWLTTIKKDYDCNLFFSRIDCLTTYTKDSVYEDDELIISIYYPPS